MNKLLYVFSVFLVTVFTSKASFVSQDSTYQNFASLSQNYRKTNVDSSLFFADLALARAKELKNDSLRAGALYLRGISNYYSGDYDQSIQDFDSAIIYAEKVEDNSRLGNIYSAKGTIENRLGLFERAKISAEKGLKIHKASGDKRKMAVSYSNLGNLLSDQNDLSQGLSYHTASYKIYQELQDTGKLAMSLNNLALTYFDYSFHEKAKQLFKNKIAYCEIVGDHNFLCSGYINLGDVYLATNNADSATLLFQKALTIAKSLESNEYQTYALLGLSKVALNNKDLNGAAKYLQEAKRVQNKGNTFLEEYFYFIEGKYLLANNRPIQAIPVLEKSLQLSAQLENTTTAKKTTQALAEAYSSIGDNKNSVRYYQKALALGDSLQEAKKQGQMEILAWEKDQELFERLKNSQGEIHSLKSEQDRLESFLFKVLEIGAGLAFIGLFFVFFQLYKRKKKEMEISNLAREKAEDQAAFSRKLEKSQARTISLIKGFMDGSPSIMGFFDEDFKLLNSNHSFHKILGRSKSDVKGKPIQELFPDLSQEHLALLKSVRETGQSIQFEEVIELHKDESLPKEKTTFNFHLFKVGSRLGFQMNDISTFKKVEQELRRAKEEAESALKSKTDFLSTINHELRTPLNGVIGLGNICLDKNKDPELDAHLKNVVSSGKLLLSLVNNVLDFAKIESGNLTPERISFPILSPFEEVASVMKVIADEKSIVCNLTLPDNQEVVGDPTLLKQVYYNLFSNAIKFTPEHGQIDVKGVLTKGPNGCMYTFSVSDNGVGIPEDKIGDIFKPFTQVDSSTKRQFGGTGLGLSIVQKIVKSLGGTVSIKSKENQGTTVSFSIPLEECKSAVQRNETTQETRTLHSANILVVEDQKVNQIVISNYLKKWGCNFQLASDGFEAIELAKETIFNCVLMDLHMPGMNGVETAEKLNELREHQTILLTADNSYTPPSGLFQDIVLKPIDPFELNQSLSNLFHGITEV